MRFESSVKGIKETILGSTLIAAATIGAGMFALPHVVSRGGYLLSTAYLAGLSAAVIYAHILYRRTREVQSGRLLKISEGLLGRPAGIVAAFSILGGLTLALVAYLILGAKFLAPIFGSEGAGLLFFWAAASLPLILGISRIIKLEAVGSALTAGIIIFIFASSLPWRSVAAAQFSGDFFLPFGAILFSLAGWTGVEPMMDVLKRGKNAILALIFGTVAVAILYALFVLGIFNSAPRLTPDTISGLIGWPIWKFWTVVALGVFALWTIYQSIAQEIKMSLEDSFRLDPALAAGFVAATPLFLVWAGMSDVSEVVGLAGGVFLAMQYVFIILSARKKLSLGGVEKFLSATLACLFLAGAIYEIYYFAIK